MIIALRSAVTASAPQITHLSYPVLAWAAAVLSVIMGVTAGWYMNTSSNEDKMKHVKTFVTLVSAVVALLIFTYLFRVQRIQEGLYTTLLSVSLGGGLGYKINDLGYKKGKEAARED